ncbi:hypothetical protein GXW82_12850 [Streptacidiphilus sp. 4-A2]|nr:hypothetical protein [Streptacidiphilus sp. 4-A2]
MAAEHSLRDLLHAATHRVPGVPAHVEHPAGHQAGHQGNSPHQHAPRPAAAPDHSRNGTRNHSSARPPRVLVAWQRRIADFLGQELH